MILALGGFAVAMQAWAVQAPPRPPGSDQVVVDAGVNPDEVQRQKRAHSHSRLTKKDLTRNDLPVTHSRNVLLDVSPGPKEPRKSKHKHPRPKSN